VPGPVVAGRRARGVVRGSSCTVSAWRAAILSAGRDEPPEYGPGTGARANRQAAALLAAPAPDHRSPPGVRCTRHASGPPRKLADVDDAMSVEVQFFFYLAAVVCFVLAALGSRVRAQVAFVPLGLALFVFPTMWNTGALAF